MHLVVIRHAIAEDKEEFAKSGQDDSARPLTKAGGKRMTRVARGLRRLVPALDVLGTSPFTRAMETAQIISGVYGGPEPIEVPHLTLEGRADEFLTWLVGQGNESTVAIVGHEPSLGMLASDLMARASHFIEFKKGGACLIAWPGVAAAGHGQLQWLMEPKQLRIIGKAGS